MALLEDVWAAIGHCAAECSWTPWGLTRQGHEPKVLAARGVAPTRARRWQDGSVTLHARQSIDWRLSETVVVAFYEVKHPLFVCYAVPPSSIVVRRGCVLRLPRSEP